MESLPVVPVIPFELTSDLWSLVAEYLPWKHRNSTALVCKKAYRGMRNPRAQVKRFIDWMFPKLRDDPEGYVERISSMCGKQCAWMMYDLVAEAVKKHTVLWNTRNMILEPKTGVLVVMHMISFPELDDTMGHTQAWHNDYRKMVEKGAVPIQYIDCDVAYIDHWDPKYYLTLRHEKPEVTTMESHSLTYKDQNCIHGIRACISGHNEVLRTTRTRSWEVPRVVKSVLASYHDGRVIMKTGEHVLVFDTIKSVIVRTLDAAYVHVIFRQLRYERFDRTNDELIIFSSGWDVEHEQQLMDVRHDEVITDPDITYDDRAFRLHRMKEAQKEAAALARTGHGYYGLYGLSMWDAKDDKIAKSITDWVDSNEHIVPIARDAYEEHLEHEALLRLVLDADDDS